MEPVFISLAFFIAKATAWLDSSAGMMPSYLDSAKKARTASSSLTASYCTRPRERR